MAKKVIIASGGALVFESQEGKGSTFGFTFPLSQP
jgi:signal transduction histidine kinase